MGKLGIQTRSKENFLLIPMCVIMWPGMKSQYYYATMTKTRFSCLLLTSPKPGFSGYHPACFSRLPAIVLCEAEWGNFSNVNHYGSEVLSLNFAKKNNENNFLIFWLLFLSGEPNHSQWCRKLIMVGWVLPSLWIPRDWGWSGFCPLVTVIFFHKYV